MSTEVYESTKTVDEYSVYADLTAYLSVEGVEMYDESAIYLSSTAASTLPGLSSLPEDTVIVVKKISPMASYWNKKGSGAAYDDAIKILEKLLNCSK